MWADRFVLKRLIGSNCYLREPRQRNQCNGQTAAFSFMAGEYVIPVTVFRPAVGSISFLGSLFVGGKAKGPCSSSQPC